MLIFPPSDWQVFFDLTDRDYMADAVHIGSPKNHFHSLCGYADSGGGLPIKFRTTGCPSVCSMCLEKAFEINNIALTSEQFRIVGILENNHWKLPLVGFSATSVPHIQSLIDMSVAFIANGNIHGTIVAQNYFKANYDG